MREKSKQIFDLRQEKTEVRITVAVKLAYDKDKAAAEGQQNAQQNTAKAFWKLLVCWSKMSALTSDFIHPNKEYINCIFSDLSAEMMSTQNDSQNNSGLMVLDQACFNTNTIFSC